MNQSTQYKIWLNPGESRYFLIPENHDPPKGNFLLQELDGNERKVNLDHVEPYEITEAAAKAHLKAEVNKVLGPVKDALSAFGLDLASAAGRTEAGPDSQAAVTDATPKAGRENSDALKAALIQLFGGLIQVMEGTTTQSGAQPAQSRKQMRVLRRKLQKLGLTLDQRFDTLPEELHRRYLSGQEQDLGALAAKLRQAADMLDQTSRDTNLDEVAESLKRGFGHLLGIEDEEEQRWEDRRQEYRSLARDAIAKSLKAHGITPLASEDPCPESK